MPEQIKNLYVHLKTYIYLLWDGLGFFGHDDNKLPRLKGIPPKWYDRFKNSRWIVFNIGMVFVFLIILVHQAQRIGNVK